MSTHERFSEHTRSTAFNLNLSHKMVDSLLWLHRMEELLERREWLREHRYTWIEPRHRGYIQGTFQGAETAEKRFRTLSPTHAALHRRGLFDIVEVDVPEVVIDEHPLVPLADPAFHAWVIALSAPGRHISDALRTAGFDNWLDVVPPWFQIKRHPDDRIKVSFEEGVETIRPVDRRIALVKAHPEDLEMMYHIKMDEVTA